MRVGRRSVYFRVGASGLLACLLLAGCGGGPAPVTGAGATQAESQTTTTVTSTPTAAAPPATPDDPFGDQMQTTGVIGVRHDAP